MKSTWKTLALLLVCTGARAQSLESLKAGAGLPVPDLQVLGRHAAAMAGVERSQALAAPRSAAAERIAQVTWAAPENLKKTNQGGKAVWRLYGRVINDASTKGGRLACARVASILLNKAGVGVGVRDGVGEVESQLRGSKRWERVASLSALEPGDVVVWRKRFADEACTGGGDCHIGIYWGTGLAYDNDGKLGHPIRYPVAPRAAYAFKAAYRAR